MNGSPDPPAHGVPLSFAPGGALVLRGRRLLLLGALVPRAMTRR